MVPEVIPSELRRLPGFDRERGPGVGHAGEGVAVVEFLLAEHLLVVVFDVLLGGAVEDMPRTRETLTLPAGVGKVPALVLARFEQ